MRNLASQDQGGWYPEEQDPSLTSSLHTHEHMYSCVLYTHQHTDPHISKYNFKQTTDAILNQGLQVSLLERLRNRGDWSNGSAVKSDQHTLFYRTLSLVLSTHTMALDCLKVQLQGI